MILPMADRPEAGASSLSRREFVLTLRLWIRPHTNLSEALESLVVDVQKAMLLDPRRGALAEDTREGELTYLYLDSEALEAGADIEYVDPLSHRDRRPHQRPGVRSARMALQRSYARQLMLSCSTKRPRMMRGQAAGPAAAPA